MWNKAYLETGLEVVSNTAEEAVVFRRTPALARTCVALRKTDIVFHGFIGELEVTLALTMAAKEQGESEFEVSISGEQRTNKGHSRRAVVPYCRGRLCRYTCDVKLCVFPPLFLRKPLQSQSHPSQPCHQRPIPRCAMCSLTSPVLCNSQESLLEGRQTVHHKSPKKNLGCFVVLKVFPSLYWCQSTPQTRHAVLVVPAVCAVHRLRHGLV